jgi:outer membrane biosynthesis protein TonB
MFKRENNAGLYLTIAVHLLVLIILLAARINSIISEDTSFLIDFSKQEEAEVQEKQLQLREDVNKELDAELYGTNAVRNVVVDASSRKGQDLKDDRFKNPNQVYEEAKRLQERLDASRREAEQNQGSDEVKSGETKTISKTESYKGPSVVSYNVAGRKALSLPIPAYKCLGGGDVNVAIIVNKKGYVIAAEVIYGSSSSDQCLQEFAIRAAKSSRFTASATAPDKQPGNIVYRFIAQ